MGKSARAERLLVAAAFASGLGLANHHTIVLLGPAVLFVVWRRRPFLLKNPAPVAACLVAILLGLLPYAYIPWAASRDPLLNWGSVDSLKDLYAHFIRADYGTGRLVSEITQQGGSAAARVLSLVSSFSALQGVLLPLGAIHAYRHLRWYFWFTLLAFAVTGPSFAAYANINLSMPVAPFILRRFFLLPHVIVAPLAALGIGLLTDVVAASLARVNRQVARVGVAVCALAAVVGALVASYGRVDQRNNHVASRFAEDILASAEPRSILLLSADEVVLPIAYLQAVNGERPDVTAVWLDLLRADWYLRQLRRRHPDLVVPFSRYDPRSPSSTVKALIDANRGRPIAIFGIVPDQSLRNSYWLYRRGLVGRVEPMAKDIELPEMARENERLLRQYHTPSADAIKAEGFESRILRAYAVPAQWLAAEYENARL